MRILVTGGCGFIGSHLVEFYTSGGMDVSVLDDLSSGSTANLVHPEGVALTVGDVADPAVIGPLVEAADAVYHLAAIASVDVCTNEPERAERTNVGGTQAVFDAVAQAQKKTGRVIPLVYASSAAIYGDNPNLPLGESAAPSPLSAYGRHKLENERIAARAFAEHGVRSVGLRFFNVYGPRQDAASPYSGVISKFVAKARAGEALILHGDGEQSRDFVYVRDVVNMLVRSQEYARAMAEAALLNVCTGTGTSVKLLARTIGMALGARELAIEHAPARAGDIRHSLGDPFRIMNLFQVARWTPLFDGLAETLAHA